MKRHKTGHKKNVHLEKYFPQSFIRFLHVAGETAVGLNMRLYMVGGVVRDILWGKENFDLDLAVEGDVFMLAEHLSKNLDMEIKKRSEFMTCFLESEKQNLRYS